jgi:hypothetical protein
MMRVRCTISASIGERPHVLLLLNDEMMYTHDLSLQFHRLLSLMGGHIRSGFDRESDVVKISLEGQPFYSLSTIDTYHF